MSKLSLRVHCSQAITAILVAAAMQASAQDGNHLSLGTYRVEGGCSKTFYLGAAAAPECDHYIGIQVKTADKPMFIFPLANGGGAWFFVTSAQTSSSADGDVYTVEKLFDQALGAEFSFPAGECVVTRQKVRCTVWKDAGRAILSRELAFSADGNWMHSK